MNPTRLFSSFLGLTILALASGCGTTFSPVKVQQSSLNGSRVIPRRAALVLDKDFCAYKHHFKLVGGTDVYPIGDALQEYARNVTTKSFQQVDVVPPEQNPFLQTADDLVLTPRVVKSDTSFGKGKFFITLVVEWTAKDRASHNTIWLRTITANGTEPMGSAFTTFNHRRMLFQKVFDDLSPKTYQAFQDAHELDVVQPAQSAMMERMPRP